MPFAELIALATLLLKIVSPLATLISNALASGQDVTEALAAESVAGILAEQGHLDAAMALAHADRIAAQLAEARDRDSANAMGDRRGWAYIDLAIAKHALTVAN